MTDPPPDPDRTSSTEPSFAAAADRAAGLDCLRCGARIQPIGVEEIRTGGSTGATHFLFGAWAEMGEGKLPVEVYVCPRCRHIEMRAPR